jgi:predicted DsbA family dithiol-disulfide isomerase
LGRKLGGPLRARQIFARTTEVAAASGLDLHFDRGCWRTRSTPTGWSGTPSDADVSALVDALYRAHFTDGVDVGSHEALARVAASAGLDEREARAFLDSAAGVDELGTEVAEAKAMGVTAVPMFVFAGKYAVSGAQEPETMRQVLTEVERLEAGAATAQP